MIAISVHTGHINIRFNRTFYICAVCRHKFAYIPCARRGPVPRGRCRRPGRSLLTTPNTWPFHKTDNDYFMLLMIITKSWGNLSLLLPAVFTSIFRYILLTLVFYIYRIHGFAGFKVDQETCSHPKTNLNKQAVFKAGKLFAVATGSVLPY